MILPSLLVERFVLRLFVLFVAIQLALGDAAFAVASEQTKENLRPYPEYVSIAARDAELLLRITAILVGGLWAYFKFVRGRIFRPRLEPAITCSVIKQQDGLLLWVKTMIKNVGLSKVNIDRRNSHVRLLMPEDLPANIKDPISIRWVHRATFPAIEMHDWIESGETIQEDRLVALSDHDPLEMRVEILVASGRRGWWAMNLATGRSVGDDLSEEGGKSNGSQG